MRGLTSIETRVVRWFADRLEEPQRSQLLTDLENASADDGNFPTIEFHVEGYARSSNSLEHPLSINAVVMDADGETVLVELIQDDNGRLYELELNRCAPGEVIGPDWSTLRHLRAGETVDWTRADHSD